MAHIEKTVFISYRRQDISWALAVYQYLTSQQYDVFFDYTSLSSGDFEQIIVSNIRARAHFVLILTPAALDRCNEPGDWLRREIETAVDEKRNIIPLFFEGFNFNSPSVAVKLTGKLGAIQRHNGLEIPSGYFLEAMERLKKRYLNVPLEAVIHPVSTEVQQVVQEEQIAANQALVQEWEHIKELLGPVDERSIEPGLSPAQTVKPESAASRLAKDERRRIRPILYGVSGSCLLVTILAVVAVSALRNRESNVAPGVTSPGVEGSSAISAGETVAAVLITPIPSETMVVEESTPATAISSGNGDTFVSPQDGMVLLYVPAGEFTMGSDNGRADEKPVHQVYLDPFWIDRTEVTNEMYSLCVTAGVCPAHKRQVEIQSRTRHLGYYGVPEFDNFPVIYVDWNMAAIYCNWAGRRLPTEAEWEKAARGLDGRTYPWGHNLPHITFLNNSLGDTTEVGSYPDGASPYGALDMAGNVWEWVNDLYHSGYYAESPASNPLGPLSGPGQVVRGGSFRTPGGDHARSTYRHFAVPWTVEYDIGFRCARDE